MANFGELVLVLGDLHIPHRASKIPGPFKRMLVPNKMQHVICTGNISMEEYAELQSLAPNVHVVSGDYNDDQSGGGGGGVGIASSSSLQWPETCVLQVGAFRVGVIHGHQILPWNCKAAAERMRRKLNVDILVTGHSHQNEVRVQNDLYYHINPGSITGAWTSHFSGDQEEVTPSFILLAVQDTKVVCYVYELVNGEVEVSKTEFVKRSPADTAENNTPSANSALMASLLS